MTTSHDMLANSIAPLLEAEQELLNALIEKYEPKTKTTDARKETDRKETDRKETAQIETAQKETDKKTDNSTQAVLDELERLSDRRKTTERILR